MDKLAKVKTLVICLGLLLVMFSIVYASENVFSISEKKQDNLVLLTSHFSNSSDRFKSFKAYDYIENNSKEKYKVQIIEFGSEDELNNWIKPKIENSAENTLLINKSIFFNRNESYIFWISGVNFVKMLTKEEENKSETIKTNAKNNEISFPETLVSDYLLKYPNDCTNNGCFSESFIFQNKIYKGLKWFSENSEKTINPNRYIGGGGKCPNTEEKFERIEKDFFLDKSEIALVREDCEKNMFYEIKGLEFSDDVKRCIGEIDTYIRNNTIGNYDNEIVWEECSRRTSFLENNKDFSLREIDGVFENRNEKILRVINNSNLLRSQQKVKIVRQNN